MTLVITYRATNQNNGHWYVGSTTTSLERRKREHLNSKQNLPFQNSLRKNPEAFKWEVLDESEEDTVVRSHEQYVLDGWHGTECCYNLNPKATGCTSEQASERLYLQRENPEFVALVGESVSKRNREKWKDEEYRNLMSNAVKKKWEEEEYKQMQSNLSKKRWEDKEFRQKMIESTRESTTEMWKDPNYAVSFSNAIELTNLETGEKLRFKSVREANRRTGFSRGAIVRLVTEKIEVLKGHSGRYLTKEEALELY